MSNATRNGHVKPPVTPPEVEGGRRTTTPSLPTSVAERGREGLVEDLVDRGVRPGNAASLVADWPGQRVQSAIAYVDERRAAGEDLGGGMVVAAVREGRAPAPTSRSTLDRQRAYGEQIAQWLWAHFPGLCDERWGPHPAAISEVIRLHQRHGKGRLTVREHGPAVRTAVRTFDAKWGVAEMAA